jgi:hypothetical protein
VAAPSVAGCPPLRPTLPGNQLPGRSRCRARTMPSRSPGHGELPPLESSTPSSPQAAEARRTGSGSPPPGARSAMPRDSRDWCARPAGPFRAGRLVKGQPGANAGRSALR